MVVCVIFGIRLKLKDFGWHAKEKLMPEIELFLLIAVILNTSDYRTLTKQNLLVSALCFSAVRCN